MNRKIFTTLSVITILSFLGCSDKIDNNIKQYAKDYTLKKSDEYSYNNYKRIKWFIESPKSITTQERAYTVIKAAKECKKQTQAKECTIYQLTTQSSYLWGGYFYTVGTIKEDNSLEVEVSDIQLTQIDVNIIELYANMRFKYQDMEAVKFEKMFYQMVSEQLNIPLEDVKLPWITRKNFTLD